MGISRKVVKEIYEIKEKYGLTPEILLNHAKNKKSALHKLFEWNNNIAGEQYRIHQARLIINRVTILINGQNVPAFEMVKVGIKQQEYKTVKEIVSKKELRKQVLQKAYDQLDYWRSQYEFYDYPEFRPIIKSIKKLKKKIK